MSWLKQILTSSHIVRTLVQNSTYFYFSDDIDNWYTCNELIVGILKEKGYAKKARPSVELTVNVKKSEKNDPYERMVIWSKYITLWMIHWRLWRWLYLVRSIYCQKFLCCCIPMYNRLLWSCLRINSQSRLYLSFIKMYVKFSEWSYKMTRNCKYLP